MRDIRAYPEPKSKRTRSSSRSQSHSSEQSSSQQSSRKRSPSSYTSTTRESAWKSSAYDPGFQQHLEDHGIFPEGYDDAEPANLGTINEALEKSRSSLSPSKFTKEYFTKFKKRNREANTESTFMRRVFPLIIEDSDIPTEGNLPFKSLAHITDDLNVKVRDDLSTTIAPSSNTSAPCLPNFFAEGKGLGGHANTAKRQACYDGALGARAIPSLRSYTDPRAVLDGNAYTIASTYGGGAGGGRLTLYATYATPASLLQ